MIGPVNISMTREFRDYVIDKRDHKRIDFFNFSSDHGEFKVEYPYRNIKTKKIDKPKRKFAEPILEPLPPDSVIELLRHCVKMVECSDVIKKTFEDIVENDGEDEVEINVNGTAIEWEEIKKLMEEE